MNQVTANFKIDRTAQVVHTFTEDLGGGVLLDMVQPFKIPSLESFDRLIA
jgi:hypothetical protein